MRISDVFHCFKWSVEFDLILEHMEDLVVPNRLDRLVLFYISQDHVNEHEPTIACNIKPSY